MLKQTICESENILAKKELYLNSSFDEQEALARWKRRECARSWFKFLMIFSLLAGIATASVFWYFNREATDITAHFNSLYALAAGVILFILFAVIRAAISSSCKKHYLLYCTNSVRAVNRLDSLKREQFDPVLDNTIVIGVKASLEAPVEYEYENDDTIFDDDDDDYEYVSSKHLDAEQTEILRGTVNSALVFIDGIEVGAIDLDSPFTTFRVTPGLHSVKLRLRKEFPYYSKELNLETPINPISINGGYHVVLYSLDCKMKKSGLNYALKVAEYDDMVTFLRDVHHTNGFEEFDNAITLSRKLKKRAKKLRKQLFADESIEELARFEEAVLFGNEKVLFDDISARLCTERIDARFSPTPKLEISAIVQNLANQDK